MNFNTKVVQVTNVSPSTTSEQMRTLFGFLGTIEELKLFPPDDSPMPVTSRVCFVKFQEQESVGVSQHLTNTVFLDRALIVVPFAEASPVNQALLKRPPLQKCSIPDESKALSLLAPANAVAGILPGGGLLPTPNPLPNPIGANPFGAPNMDALAAFGFPGANMNPGAADQFLKFMTDPKLNPLAVGLNLSASLKADASNKEIEEAMKRVREAQSLISAAIEPGSKDKKRRSRSRSRSRSRRRRTRSRSRHRRTRSRSRRRSGSRNRRRSKSPRKRRSRSRDRKRSRSRERKKDEGRKRSRTPPKSYSTARRSRSTSRRRRRSRSGSRSPKKSPKRMSRTPSPRRHKKEKKRDKDRDRERRGDKDRSRDDRDHSKKKRSKDKDRDQERKLDGEKDVKVTRDYDEEEQGYDSEKERRKDSEDSMSPHSEDNGTSRLVKIFKVNGSDDHREEDMDVSD